MKRLSLPNIVELVMLALLPISMANRTVALIVFLTEFTEDF